MFKSKIDKNDPNYTKIHGYISLLRGVNVGGNNKIVMSELVAAYESIGLTNVISYIQSGNVMFESTDHNQVEIKAKIEGMIQNTFDLGVTVLVREKESFQELSFQNPFLGKSKVNIKNLYVTFLSEAPTQDAIDSLQELTVDGEEWVLNNLEIFSKYENGYGKAKLNNQFFEKKLGVSATTRNWKSVISLHNILGE